LFNMQHKNHHWWEPTRCNLWLLILLCKIINLSFTKLCTNYNNSRWETTLSNLYQNWKSLKNYVETN
jgi:hypothetical protein